MRPRLGIAQRYIDTADPDKKKGSRPLNPSLAAHDTAGAMFLFMRNKFLESHFVLTSTSRS
jgi:hypothetical protein